MNTALNRSWIEINLGALENNVRRIKAALPKGTVYIAVVKADAYGHSLPRSVVRFLKGGADMFAVANIQEVSRIRELVSSKPVLVLSPLLPDERRLVFEYGATPAISTLEEALDFSLIRDAFELVTGYDAVENKSTSRLLSEDETQYGKHSKQEK